MSKLICFEGVDGCGKSTICKKLYQALNKKHKVILLHQPGTTPLGTKIRHLLLDNKSKIDYVTERLLFSADNADFVNYLSEIRKDYDYILLDRCTFISEQVYSKALNNNHIIAVQQHLSKIIPNFKEFIPKSYLVVINVSKEVYKSRKLNGDRIEKRGKKYLDKVYNIYNNNDFNWTPYFSKLYNIQNNDKIDNVINEINKTVLKEKK